MSRRAAEHAAGYGETGRSSTGAARRVGHRSAAAIGNDSPRLLTTRRVRTTHSRAVNRPCVARVMQQESTRISTGREATLPDGPAWSEKPCHAFSVANGARVQLSGTSQKHQAVSRCERRISACNDARSAYAWFVFFLGIDDD